MDDDHRHCKSCGKVCAPGQETCSNDCRQRRERALQSRKNFTYILYGLILFVLVLSVFRGL